MHRMELATASSVALNDSFCSCPQANGVSFLVSHVMGSMIVAQLGIWFLMKLIVPIKVHFFSRFVGGASLRMALICFFVGQNPF